MDRELGEITLAPDLYVALTDLILQAESLLETLRRIEVDETTLVLLDLLSFRIQGLAEDTAKIRKHPTILYMENFDRDNQAREHQRLRRPGPTQPTEE